MNKKTLTVIFIVLAILIVGVILYAFRCKLFNRGCVEDPNKNNEPVPAGSPTTVWVKESFPLNIGMYGDNIKALQTALGVSADGKFGPITSAAVKAKGYAVPLSYTDFNKIIFPNPAGGGTNFQKLKAALAGGSQNFSSGIQYPMSGANDNFMFDFYTNGRFVLHKLNSSTIILKGSYTDGGKNFKIDNGPLFTSGPYQNMQLTLDHIKDWLLRFNFVR